MSVLLIALRFALDTQAVTEVFADWLTMLLPPALFDLLLDRLQFSAKRILFVLILLGQVGVGGGIGILVARMGWTNSGTRLLAGPLPMGVAIWAVLGAGLTPIAGAGLFGAGVPGGALSYSLSLLGGSLAYSFGLAQMLELGVDLGGDVADGGRRAFLKRAVVFTTAIVIGSFALRTIVDNLSRLTPAISGRIKGQLSTPVTPNDEFYVVAKSAFTPSVSSADWRLKVGTEESEFELTYDELLALPSVEQYVTLTCISNPIGGDLISTALWKGVPLPEILALAGLPAETARLAFHAADGYVDSFEMDVAMRDNVLVAYEMNGVPLPEEHGFPARIVVPGLYGMENVKWLYWIQPVPLSYRGYWQHRGWADTAVIKTLSRIDTPGDRDRLAPSEARIAGVAFAGDRGIRKIEVSLDDGATWEEVDMSDPLSPYTWVIWELPWDATPGTYSVQVRATDSTGTLQTEKPSRNLPDGADGFHRIRFVVQSPQTTDA